eukprot:scaffold157451_cov40-Prasinocladus_malaysianus.AAC.1
MSPAETFVSSSNWCQPVELMAVMHLIGTQYCQERQCFGWMCEATCSTSYALMAMTEANESYVSVLQRL